MPHAVTDRPTYHHGDLRNALIAAGAKLAERGGPAAVGVRAAAREVGVTPTAAYRHFANASDLLIAVKEQTMESMLEALRADLDRVDTSGHPGEVALHRLEALGRAYVKVGLTSPGLFRMAFCESGSPLAEDELPPTFALLVQTLDELVAAGYLPAERRPLAEIAAWSSVHGLVMLVIDGQLGEIGEDELELAMSRVAEMVTTGFAGTRVQPSAS